MIQVINKGKLLAIIIPSDYHKNGVEFFTPNDSSLQLAFMSHPKEKSIEAHIHNVVPRKIMCTNEVLIIRKGKLRIDFYDENQVYLESYILQKGDTILLSSGGHGFKCLTKVDMVEIKQGPYLGELDKVRFQGVNQNEVKIK